MPDISMCQGWGCADRDTCWRYLAPVSGDHQAWASFDHMRSEHGCGHYMPVNEMGGSDGD